MIDSVFVIGKPGSGKTEMVRFQTSLLTADGFVVDTLSDRLWLEEAVLLDTKDGSVEPETGIRIGPHSKLLKDGAAGHRKIHVLDGILLNRVHDAMVEYINERRQPGTIVIAEYAIGPDISFGPEKEPLLQSCTQMIERFKRYLVKDHVLVIDVEAPVVARTVRESLRPDAMDPETFRIYFPDGGEMTDDGVSLLGPHYLRIENGHSDFERFHREATETYQRFVFPNIRSEGLLIGHFR
jgi:hypothetical protein